MPAASSARRAPSSSSSRVSARIAVDGLPHLVQRLASDSLDVPGVLGGRRRVAVGEATYCLGLDHHHRQGVPEQVVQVAGEPLALLGDRASSQLLPGPPQLLDRLDEPEKAGARHPRRAAPRSPGSRCAMATRRRPRSDAAHIDPSATNGIAAGATTRGETAGSVSASRIQVGSQALPCVAPATVAAASTPSATYGVRLWPIGPAGQDRDHGRAGDRQDQAELDGHGTGAAVQAQGGPEQQDR